MHPRPLLLPSRRLHPRLATVLASLLIAATSSGGFVRAESAGSAEERCAGGARGLAPGDTNFSEEPDASPDGLHYAPHRVADVLHVHIDVTPDFRKRTIGGRTTFRFAPIHEPLRQIRLDAFRLRVDSVEAAAPDRVESFFNDDRAITVVFAEPIPVGREASVTVTHDAQPEKGIYFRTPEMGYRPEDEHLWSQGETHEARHWYPGFDHPIEKFTTEMTCRVPEGMKALSNGRLVSEAIDPATGLRAFTWLMDKPHPGYLIALAAGRFETVDDRTGRVPMAFHAPPSQIHLVANSFRETADMMRFFEEECGVPYPWDKYDQVVVDDFTWGGMENTTLTILTDRTLHPDETVPTRSSRNLVAHELAHQWFGDYVTCRDWTRLFLNEGFATYLAHRYAERAEGLDAMNYGLWFDLTTDIVPAGDTTPIAFRGFKTTLEMFSYRSYEKAGWVLHMLRNRVGPEAWTRALKLYLERNALTSVEQADLRQAFEETTGLSLDQFFEQWFEGAGVPEVEVAYEWDEAAKIAKLNVRQTQKTENAVPLYDLPTKVRFRFEGEPDRVEAISASERTQDFFFKLPKAPKVVRFDPDFALLAKVEFAPPTEMIHAQLDPKGAGADDMIGRLLAVLELGGRKDAKSAEALGRALREDPFWGVRVEAAKALAKIGSDEAFAELLAARRAQEAEAKSGAATTDARARRETLAALAGFYRPESAEALARAAIEERNPDVAARALDGLGRFPSDPVVRAQLLGGLGSASFRNTIADAAVRAMRSLDRPEFVDPIRRSLEENAGAWTTFGEAQALRAVGRLARRDDDAAKATTRDFLLARVNSPKRTIRVAAIDALGELGDPEAAPALETFVARAEGDPMRKAAEAALKKIREGKPAATDLDDLRKEVLEMKEKGEKLRGELDEMKNKAEAAAEDAEKTTE